MNEYEYLDLKALDDHYEEGALDHYTSMIKAIIREAGLEFTQEALFELKEQE
jgi:hypothetical protein